jgi:hypothetical protein|tara:strand:- start:2608 stop:3075 length:468 start_codon:yes stop_codon:yes gene_type:complete
MNSVSSFRQLRSLFPKGGFTKLGGNDIYNYMNSMYDLSALDKIIYDDNMCCAVHTSNKELIVFPKEYTYNVLNLTHKDLQLVKHLKKVGTKLVSYSTPQGVSSEKYMYFLPHPHNTLSWLNMIVLTEPSYEMDPLGVSIDVVIDSLRDESMAYIP